MSRKLRAGALLAAVVLLCGCSGLSFLHGGGRHSSAVRRPAVVSEELPFLPPSEGDKIAVIETSEGTIRAVLYPEIAPQTCTCFEQLAEAGYYDGLSFSRAEEGFMIESGLAEDGSAATPWDGKTYLPEYSKRLLHYSGALCMAVNSSGKQAGVFYIVTALPDSVSEERKQELTAAERSEGAADAYVQGGGLPELDFTDTVFGQVFEGMEAADRIASSGTGTVISVRTEQYTAAS